MWVDTGNVGSSTGHYIEGYSIPYRVVLNSITAGTWTIDLGYDAVNGGKNAIDFLTSYDRINDPLHTLVFGHTQECVDPTDGVLGTAGCGVAPGATFFQIPKPNLPNQVAAQPPGVCSPTDGMDPGNVSCPGTSWDNITAAGAIDATHGSKFAIWNGTITNVTYVTQADLNSSGNSETRIRVVFTVPVPAPGQPGTTDVVLSWGGHIGRQKDWGTANSAVGINGSPYHMRVKGLCAGTTADGALCDSAGNMDRSLSTDAVFTPPTKLTLVKQVVNNNGGTALASAWTLTATGPTTITGLTGAAAVTAAVVPTGTYNLSESAGPAGYLPSAWVCTGAFSQTSTSVTLAEGDIATCTITNDDQAAHLTLLKTVVNNNGGTALDTAWTLNAAGPTNISGIEGDAAVTSAAVSAGTYTLTESNGPSGYTQTNLACTGATLINNQITLALNQSATCTFTNADQPAQLTLLKDVVNNNGGTALDTAWTLNASGPTNISGIEGAAAVTNAKVKAGTYTLTESNGPSGYTQTNLQCTGATLTGNQITLALNQSATCTFTNTDQAAHLTLLKDVVNNNGGTALDTAWTLNASGPSNISGTEGASAVTSAAVKAGTYTLTETNGPSGYTQTNLQCTGATLTGNQITLALGGSATCTFTNTDQPAHLTLLKDVVNNNGGTALDTAWTLNASGPTNISGIEGAAAVTSAAVKAGTYTLTESNGPSGYSQTNLQCTGATLTGNQITLALGGSATCTFTNTDQAAHLTLLKDVVNNNGGTALDTAWTLNAAGPTNISGTEGAAAVTSAAVKAGTYTLTETNGPAGYTQTNLQCTGATLTGNQITLALGGSATCTFTNDDQAAHLTLIKVVINDNGGTATSTAWTLNAAGPTGISGTSGAAAVTSAAVNAGTYTLSETSGPAGYAQTNLQCTGATLTGNQITLALGGSASCTFTNNDIAPQLKVNKVLVPSTDTGTFNLRIDGTVLAGPVGDGGTTGFIPVNAGMHTASETFNLPVASSDYVTVIGGDCNTSGQVTLGLAGTATCTITNTRKGLVRVVKTANGVVPTANDPAFTFQIRTGATAGAQGTIVESLSTSAGNGTLNFTTKLIPGSTYQMCELATVGYTTTLAGFPVVFNPANDPAVFCVNFTVTAGELKVFNIENTKVPTGGAASTIGYWKNWASCSASKGKQLPILDQTIENYGFVLNGLLKIDDQKPLVTGDIGSDCDKAVAVLNKSAINGGRKLASDPVFNLASQFMAYLLNVKTGATPCNDLASAAQAFLVSVGFNGTATHANLTAAQAAYANTLAGYVDIYNNNGGCPASLPTAP